MVTIVTMMTMSDENYEKDQSWNGLHSPLLLLPVIKSKVITNDGSHNGGEEATLRSR